jgi:hypothetical protein
MFCVAILLKTEGGWVGAASGVWGKFLDAHGDKEPKNWLC